MEYKDIDYSKAKKVLEVKDLRVNFKSDSGLVHAVRGVSFDLYKGETLCIVGESGSGKSTFLLAAHEAIKGEIIPKIVIMATSFGNIRAGISA